MQESAVETVAGAGGVDGRDRHWAVEPNLAIAQQCGPARAEFERHTPKAGGGKAAKGLFRILLACDAMRLHFIREEDIEQREDFTQPLVLQPVLVPAHIKRDAAPLCSHGRHPIRRGGEIRREGKENMTGLLPALPRCRFGARFWRRPVGPRLWQAKAERRW